VIPVDRDEKRRTILKAALAVFSRNGFERATIADIAKQARIAKGVVYDYFPSKEELFTDLFEYLFPRDEATFRRFIDQAADPIEEIEAVAAAIMSHYESLGEYFNVIAQFWARGQSDGASARFAKCWQEVYGYCRQSMAASIQRGIDAGLLREDLDVAKAAWTMVAIVDGSILQWLHSRAQFPLHENGMAAVRLLLRSMARRPEELDSREPHFFHALRMTDRSVASPSGRSP
jgi:AcrR family transcriptional regulator